MTSPPGSLNERISPSWGKRSGSKSVGPFRADILCRDTATGDWVLIENQLERTDHTHLGQLITYAAGLRAVTIVWVANPFTEEHRAALDWMNDITDTRFNFFGLEVELWRIGDSPLAPKFNAVSKPNDWSKTVAEGVSRVELSETQQLQLDFWTAFRTYASEHAVSIKPIKPLPQGWMGLAVGRTGFGLHAIASLWNSEREHYDTNEVRAELQISNNQSHSYFALLETEKDEIHAELGFPLTWYAPPDQKMKKIYARRDADLRDRKSWGERASGVVDFSARPDEASLWTPDPEARSRNGEGRQAPRHHLTTQDSFRRVYPTDKARSLKCHGRRGQSPFLVREGHSC